jgi:hypothetical protein
MGMPQWVTIAEAIKLTGKSENTIRRFIYDLQKTNKEVAARVITKSSTGAYQIEAGFLYTKYPHISTNGQPMSSPTEQPKGNNSPTHQTTQELDPIIKAKDETISILKSQLEKQAVDFREQLNRRDEQMKMMFERMRENNMIIQNLALPAPQKGDALEPVGVIKDTQASNHDDTHSVPLGSPSEQPKPPVVGTRHRQKRSGDRQKGVKATHRQPQKLTQKPAEQPKKKGFLSWLR